MIEITDEMRSLIDNALANGTPCILATASPTGEPSVSYRGSMMVYDDESLAYWERTYRAGLEHVEANPKVVVMYRDPTTRKAWKFHGDATVYREGVIREGVMARVVQPELDRDPEFKGFTVIIRLDRIMTMAGEVVQQREQEPAAGVLLLLSVRSVCRPEQRAGSSDREIAVPSARIGLPHPG